MSWDLSRITRDLRRHKRTIAQTTKTSRHRANRSSTLVLDEATSFPVRHLTTHVGLNDDRAHLCVEQKYTVTDDLSARHSADSQRSHFMHTVPRRLCVCTLSLFGEFMRRDNEHYLIISFAGLLKCLYFHFIPYRLSHFLALNIPRGASAVCRLRSWPYAECRRCASSISTVM